MGWRWMPANRTRQGLLMPTDHHHHEHQRLAVGYFRREPVRCHAQLADRQQSTSTDDRDSTPHRTAPHQHRTRPAKHRTVQRTTSRTWRTGRLALAKLGFCAGLGQDRAGRLVIGWQKLNGFDPESLAARGAPI
jgi:hypothetical protein